MLDKDFLQIKREVSRLLQIVNSATDNYDREGKENSRIYSLMEDFSYKLEDIVAEIDYWNRTPEVATIYEQENGRFRGDNCGWLEFSCGSRVELLIPRDKEDVEVEWCDGVIEYNNGYYFKNLDGNNRPYLEDGMKVSKRY